MKDNNPELNPIDLRKEFGERYKIDLDESAFCPGESKKNPWYFLIPCKYGHIYPHSDWRLAFYCESGRIRGRLHREHLEIEIRQWSDIGEAVFLFTPDQFDLIARYAMPRKRRRLSEAHKKKLAESNRGFRFEAKNHASERSLTEKCREI